MRWYFGAAGKDGKLLPPYPGPVHGHHFHVDAKDQAEATVKMNERLAKEKDEFVRWLKGNKECPGLRKHFKL